jgi:surfeit locus 1 family protein
MLNPVRELATASDSLAPAVRALPGPDTMPLISGRSFRPAWWGFALALAGCAAGVALGNWQLHRAEERRAVAAAIDAAQRAPAIDLPPGPFEARDYALRRVAARGEFVAAQTIFLEYKIRHGRIGYEVITPLRLAPGTMHVLVNRGWLPAGPRPDQPPEVVTPRGELRVEGIALERLPHALDASSSPPSGRIWQNLRVEDFRAASGLAVQPVIIEQRSESGDGLARDWPQADSGARKNEMYAMQWYSLAALAVILFIVLSFRREPSN